jgi:glucokinase
MSLVVGVDVGGSRISAGLVDQDGRVVIRQTTPTPSRPADLVPVVATVIEAFRRGYQVDAVGLGVAGFVDRARSTVLYSTEAGWSDEPLAADLGERLGLPIVVENAGSAACWGEARFGAGVGETCLVALTVGTGLGGGFVFDGRPYRGRFGVAAEYGHVPVVPDGLLCGCGNRGCWEMYASGRALTRRARALAAAGDGEAKELLERSGGAVERITYRLVAAAARDGDPAAVALVEALGRWLGAGIANIAAVLDPGRVVVGGGLVAVITGLSAGGPGSPLTPPPPPGQVLPGASPARHDPVTGATEPMLPGATELTGVGAELLLAPARDAFRRALPGRGYRPEADIVLAALGRDSGVVGAADLARRRF